MRESTADRSVVSVRRFFDLAEDRMRLSIVAGRTAMAERLLDSDRVQKLGLALSGFTTRIHRQRIQIWGKIESHFFSELGVENTCVAMSRLNGPELSCILITSRCVPPPALVDFAESTNTPLLATELPSSEAISCISNILGLHLAVSKSVHGVLMEAFGIGVLITGESGIGKSECALDLIGRGHRLVADDAVLMRRGGDRILGEAPDIIRDHLEIRGLGIINARELFGVSALSHRTGVQLSIEFVGDDSKRSMDRLGTDEHYLEVLGVRIPQFVLPVRPGRNLATLAETAVRVFVSRSSGSASPKRSVDWMDAQIGRFQHQ